MTLILPDSQRTELQKLLVGELLTEDDIAGWRWTDIVVSVGDMVTYTLYHHGIEPKIAIVDYITERSSVEDDIVAVVSQQKAHVIKVRNPPAVITDELWDAIERAFDFPRPVRIEVEGEEDLAALPAIILAPAQTTVVYGLPGRGIVCVKVGPSEKKRVEEFLKEMEKYNGD
jgi:uncharacterized protein (UPF0218 family)